MYIKDLLFKGMKIKSSKGFLTLNEKRSRKEILPILQHYVTLKYFLFFVFL